MPRGRPPVTSPATPSARHARSTEPGIRGGIAARHRRRHRQLLASSSAPARTAAGLATRKLARSLSRTQRTEACRRRARQGSPDRCASLRRTARGSGGRCRRWGSGASVTTRPGPGAAARRARRRRAARRASSGRPASSRRLDGSTSVGAHRVAAELPDDGAQLELVVERQAVVDGPDAAVAAEQARGRPCGRCCW